MHRIVHLDLKGAPLKTSYIEKVLLNAKSWGATGVLIEWEDTFPYSGDLMEIGSETNCGGDNMYSMKQVQHILTFCRENGLEPIQLIQTIGHMEFVLKHPQYINLREIPESAAVLCPSKPESLMLVKMMVQQALDVQPDATYFHIGADEVWHTGICQDCQKQVATNAFKTASLYLDHIQKLTIFIKEMRPNLTILMWDDMLRNINPLVLKFYNLGKLVEPMVWNYNIFQHFEVNPELWMGYQKTFPELWIASAFKGANGSCQILSPVSHYVSNNEAWLTEIAKHPGLELVGIVLTGWSRYDHYSTLCELMPVSLPSLASCLKLLSNFDDRPRALFISEELPSDEWPGMDLAQCIRYFVDVKDSCQAFFDSNIIKNWCTPWQTKLKYTNCAKMQKISEKTNDLLHQLLHIKNDVRILLSEITGKRSTDEWLHTNVMPTVSKLTNLLEAVEKRSVVDSSVLPALPYPMD